MKKTFIFVRHAGRDNKNAILDCLAAVKASGSCFEKEIGIVASTQKEADPTIVALERSFSRVATRTPFLNGAPDAQDHQKAARFIAERKEPVVVIITHADHAAHLPHELGAYYELAEVPAIKERKPGEVTVVKVPASKVKAAEDARLAFCESEN